MKVIKFWWTLLPFLLLSCNKDEQQSEKNGNPVSFLAAISPLSRLTINNSWTGLSGEKVGIEIGGETKEYVVNEKGELTSIAPFYWGNLSPEVSVNAWFPYNEGKKPKSVIVAADQSIAENYWASDLLEVSEAMISEKESILFFQHRAARVDCSIQLSSAEDGILTGSSITLHNLSGVEEGNSVKMTVNYRALVAPQTILAGTIFLEINLGDGRIYEYKLSEDLKLDGGYVYPISIVVAPDDIQVIFKSPVIWNGELVVADGEAPEVGPGANGDNWDSSGSDTTTGDSSEVGPDGNANGWTEGNNETTTGGSSTVKPGGNPGEWNGNNETTTGGSSTVNPGGNSSSWDGSSDTTTGSSSTVNPGNSSSGATWGGGNTTTVEAEKKTTDQ